MIQALDLRLVAILKIFERSRCEVKPVESFKQMSVTI